MSGNNFEPRIVGSLCKWCTSAATDLAGTSRKKYPANIIPIRFFCSSKIDPQHILHAFKNGADGVLIGGCHFGDYHYQNGNYKTARRVALLHSLIKDMGIDARRLRLEWISAAEGEKFTNVIKEFTEEIKKMGPIKGNEK